MDIKNVKVSSFFNKWTALAAIAVAGIVATSQVVGFNDSGHRQYVQDFWGNTKVVFEEGPYLINGGYNVDYLDFVTYDFSGKNGKCEMEESDGITVQYQDGGYGVICGQIRVPLPTVENYMKALHKEFHSEKELVSALVEKQLMNTATVTASLITSTEAYTTKRAEVQPMLKDQLLNGTYVTEIKERDQVVAIDDNGKEEVQVQEYASIATSGGQKLHNPSKLRTFGITDVEITITGFDFESKTLDQIADRRDATNRAMTAKDKAKAAYWEKEQKEAEGEKNVAIAKYEELTKAQVDIVQANRDKELAIIQAQKQSETAKELTTAAKEEAARQRELAIAAKEEAKVITTLADANAYKLREEQKAGELKLRLDNALAIATVYADGMAKMKGPDTLLITNGSANGTSGGELGTLVQFKALEQVKAYTQQANK